jgi:hypothetical protein
MVNTSMYGETEYPHPDFNLRFKLIIEKAFRVAWNHLVKNQNEFSINLNTDIEDNISERLQQIIEKLRTDKSIKGFTPRIFETVTRGQNLRNYDGKRRNMQPDIVFRFSDCRDGVNSLQDGIFVECKPIDEKHTIGKTYCNDGLMRFVKGDYAWAMPCGMMVGYVRDNSYNIPENLTPALKKQKYSRLYTVKPFTTKCPMSKKEPYVYITEHQRKWKYIGGGEPGNIVIRHLWLSVKNLNS